MKYLITYDIRDHKRWNKVFRLLKKKGLNVQLSCFEVEVEGGQLEGLIDEIIELIDSLEDKVYFFPISAAASGLITKLGKIEELNESKVL